MALLGPSRNDILSTVAEATYQGSNPVLRIKDSGLIEPSIERIRDLVQNRRRGAGETPLDFLKVDFRERSTIECLKEVAARIGDVLDHMDCDNPNSQTSKAVAALDHQKKSRLILIHPLDPKEDDELEALHLFSRYLKFGMKALTVLPAEPHCLPNTACMLVGEHCGYWHYLDYSTPTRF